ncbi:replication initiation protein [Conchiformibius steedae]|uniref:replication initiation protein n=1 Tax=Conchiformibius steedae TaxID=153493 RepID=UPI00068755AD|nr:replication initiation protein [Conchiformibius steedae]QMT32599.1 replication initiation protein [Conchiformibius steedae]
MSEHKFLSAASAVRVAQSLIHIQHNISLQQYKIWLILLRYYQANLHNMRAFDDNGFCVISNLEIAESLNVTQQSLQKMLDNLDAIRKETLVLNYLNKDNMGVSRVTGFLSEFEIHQETATVGFKLPTIVQDVLLTENLGLKQWFLLLNWGIFSSFNNKYEAIIYKLCKDYQGVGKTGVLDLDRLREYLGLKSDQYVSFKELNRKCIKVPVENLNAHEICDIDVGVEYIKRGRTVTGIRFMISPRQSAILEGLPKVEHDTPAPQEQVFQQARIAIPFDKQQQYLSQYSPEQIERIIERANAFCDQCKRQKKPVNIGGIYHKAFADNWGDTLELPARSEPVFCEWSDIPLNTHFRHENGSMWYKRTGDSLFNLSENKSLPATFTMMLIKQGVLMWVDEPDMSEQAFIQSETEQKDSSKARALAILARLNREQRQQAGQQILRSVSPAFKEMIKNYIERDNLESLIGRFKECYPVFEGFNHVLLSDSGQTVPEKTKDHEQTFSVAVTEETEKRQRYIQMLKKGLITVEEFELLIQ